VGVRPRRRFGGPRQYLTRYEQILAALDPAEVAWRASQL
jgi:hypothetical protein